MRIVRFFAAILLASSLCLSSLSAQRMPPAEVDSQSVRTLASPLQSFDDTLSPNTQSWGGRIVSGLASAVLGAGIGYFASQIAQGDWDEESGQEKLDRSAWAAVGGAGGFALGFSIPLLGRAPGTGGALPFEDDRLIITGDAIREESLGNAMEAVRFFHPEWLIQRGMESLAWESPDDIQAYLDNARLGGVGDLAGIAATIIREIRFFTGQQAAARWGTGHGHGVIQVVTRD